MKDVKRKIKGKKGGEDLESNITEEPSEKEEESDGEESEEEEDEEESEDEREEEEDDGRTKDKIETAPKPQKKSVKKR
jgi:hypothetical protein